MKGFNDKYGSCTELYICKPCVVKFGHGGIPLEVNIKCNDAKLKTTLEQGMFAFGMKCPMQSNTEYAKTLLLTIDALKPDGDATAVRQKCQDKR
jgi:hypothetical protein